MVNRIPQPAEDAARQEGHRALEAAILRMARAAGVQIHQRHPFGPSSGLAVDYADPAAGIRFAVMLRDSARQEIRDYIKYARQEGLTWEQVGEALSLRPLAEERGAWIADLAFDYAADAEHARPFQTLSFPWRCPSCGGFIIDRGPSGGHPEDDEPGHETGCARLAAAVAEYDRRARADFRPMDTSDLNPETGEEYGVGPDIDDETCPRCGAVNWGQTPDGHDECVSCGYVDGVL